MEQNDRNDELTEWLKQKGHTQDEVDKILVRVQQYEQETQLDSIMDSIGAGTLDLSSLIEDALRDSNANSQSDE